MSGNTPGPAIPATPRQRGSWAGDRLVDSVRGLALLGVVLAEAGLILALALELSAAVFVFLPGRPPAPVESAAYFAVSELLANVSKHAGARQVWIDMRYERGILRIDV